MSLLLDALKKTGQVQRDTTGNSASNAIPSANLRAAAQNLFAAKGLPAHIKGRLGIIPLALICGLLLAVGGGYYLWQAISPAPALPRAPAAAPVMQAVIPVVPTATAIPDNLPPSLQATVAKKAPPALPQPRRLAAQPTPSVQIKTGLSDGINTTLQNAYQAYRSGDFGAAWQLYRNVLQQDDHNRDALLGLAAIAQSQGQETVAAQYYNRVLMLDPRDPAAQAGMSALGNGDAASRESRLKLQLSHRPDAAVLHYALGNLYAEQSRWGEARQAYFNATTREPANAQFVFNLAVSLDHLGLGSLAAQHYQRALELDRGGNASFDHAQTQQRLTELSAH